MSFIDDGSYIDDSASTDSFGGDFTDTLSAPLNFSAFLPSQTGTSIFSDVARLVGTVYQGDILHQQAKEAAAMAQARQANALAISAASQANALENIRTTPNIWLVAGGVAVAGFLLLYKRGDDGARR